METATSYNQTSETMPAAQAGPPPRPHVEAYRAASSALSRVCSTITDWEAPGLGEWTVRDLAGHVNRAIGNVTAYLEAGTEPGAQFVDGPVAYYRAFWGRHDDEGVAERGRLAGQALGEEPARTIERDRVLAMAVVDRTPDDARLRTPVGTMTLAGYLPSRPARWPSAGERRPGAPNPDPRSRPPPGARAPGRTVQAGRPAP